MNNLSSTKVRATNASESLDLNIVPSIRPQISHNFFKFVFYSDVMMFVFYTDIEVMPPGRENECIIQDTTLLMFSGDSSPRDTETC